MDPWEHEDASVVPIFPKLEIYCEFISYRADEKLLIAGNTSFEIGVQKQTSLVLKSRRCSCSLPLVIFISPNSIPIQLVRQ